MTRARRTWLTLLGTVVAIVAAVLGSYLLADGKVKEPRPAAAGPPPAPVSIAQVAQRSLPVRIDAIGNVEAFNSVALKARVDGQIVGVKFRDGQHVTKGQVLFELDPRPFRAALDQAKANLARDRASLEHAAMQEKRYADLLQKHFVSKDAYAQFRTNAETARAQVEASQAALETARLNLDYCTIRSPIDGYAGRAVLQVGNTVKANDTTPLVVVNQVQPIYVSFAVPEQSLGEIRHRMATGPLEVDVGTTGAKQSPLGRGKLVFVDNTVDTSTGTIKLRAQFDNPDLALWPGQFVNASVKLYEQNDALVVPSVAVQTGPEGEFVFVVGAAGKAEVRKVSVERTEGDLTVVAGGLVKGEKVVTRGQLRLAPGTPVRIQAAGS